MCREREQVMLYNDFLKLIKSGEIKGVYYLTGEENYLKDYIAETLKDSIGSTNDFNQKIYQTLPPSQEVSEFFETLPFMSDKKLTIFKCELSKTKERAEYQEALSNLPDYNVVIIYENTDNKKEGKTSFKTTLLKLATEVNVPYQDITKLKKWIINICAKEKKAISPQDSEYIIRSIGNSMSVLKGEIDKIISYSDDTTITREVINKVIIKPSQDRIFTLLDSLFAIRRASCYECLKEIKNVSTPLGALSLISNQIMSAYKAKLLLADRISVGEAVKMLGGGYGAEKAVKRAQNAREEDLRNIIPLLKDMDYRVKNGLIDGFSAIEIIIAEYGVQRN